jgi:cytochrome b6-f complex iron-sulfur subunit
VAREPLRVTRRSVADYLLGAGLAALAGTVLYPVLRYLIPPPVKEVAAGSIVAAKVGELQPNSAKIFLLAGKPAILIHTPQQGAYKAFSAICTHLACTVQYRPDLGHIWSACHDGHFDLNGQVLSGPPPRPLPEYGVTVKGDDIVVTRPA